MAATGVLLLLFCFLFTRSKAPVLISESRNITDTSKDSTFTCHHPRAGSIGFKAVYQNGTAVNKDANNDIIFNTCRDENNILVYTMTIVGRLVYYGAEVICFAAFDDSQGSRPMLTLTTTSGGTKNVSVGEIATFESASCSRIDWIVNGTHLNNLSVRDGDINVTSHRAPDDITRISILSIKARLPYNGTSITSHADGASGPLPIVYVHVFVGVCQESVALNFHLMVSRRKKVVTSVIIHLNSSSNPMSDMIAIELSSLDGLDPTPTQLQVVPSFHDQKLSFTFTVPRRRIWDAALVYCKFLNFELSTHDLQNISISSPLRGQVRVTGDFLRRSTATGILVILYREEDSRIIYDLVSRKGNEIVTDVTGIDNGNYEVFLFDVEGNGTYSSATVRPVVVNVMSSNSEETPPPPKIEYEIQSISTGFRVTCSFLDSHITECVVVLHRKFSVLYDQLSVTVHHFCLGSVGNVVSGYIYVANPDDFQIAVIDGARKTKRTTSSIPWWTIVVSVLVVAGFVTVAAAVLIYKNWKKCQEAPERSSVPQQPSQSTGNGLAEIRLENRNVQKPSSIRRFRGQTSPNATTPEQESDKEVEHRKNGPFSRISRRVPGRGDGGDHSDNMQPEVSIFFGVMRHRNSMELQSQQSQHSQEDGDCEDTPPAEIPSAHGHRYRYDGDEQDGDTENEIEFPNAIPEQSI